MAFAFIISAPSGVFSSDQRPNQEQCLRWFGCLFFHHRKGPCDSLVPDGTHLVPGEPLCTTQALWLFFSQIHGRPSGYLLQTVFQPKRDIKLLGNPDRPKLKIDRLWQEI